MNRTTQNEGRSMIRTIMLTLIIVTSSGCWNSELDSLHLGDVSLGQQLIDLKGALEADALTQDEYDTAHALLLGGANLCVDDDED
jgi:hypothetical protein